MQEVLNAASFDAVYVQFCASSCLFGTTVLTARIKDNNYCGLQNFGNPEVNSFPLSI
jgi:hypothetical protein